MQQHVVRFRGINGARRVLITLAPARFPLRYRLAEIENGRGTKKKGHRGIDRGNSGRVTLNEQIVLRYRISLLNRAGDPM